MLVDPLAVCGIAGLNLYAALLVLARPRLFRTRLYRPMLLNLALSVAPLVVLALTVAGMLLVLALAPSQAALLTVLAVGGLVWLVLLPNSGYLVTELNLSHRRADESVPLWYDIVLVLSLAVSGVLNMLANVYLVQVGTVLLVYPNDDDPFARPWPWVAAVSTLVLAAFGIYLGRYVRFNTWDLLHPVGFARRLAGHLRAPGTARTALAFTATHAAFFALMYLVVVAPAVRGFGA
ncbi:DUF1361 domain-containing protein [Cellulomonas hominis]|jgi:uncharacterized membrane protein|uniref:Putative membrane protein n=1 Tax=Cellulomonas hominis TaxID=156981 RepID=A0A511FAQ8_9CELL|nr:DUF1361 domain-containing protein [Cellulomonas hominis]MBB5474468.1 putative membrane protein [Cellulomonas hominis]MBU5422581.1 DUF1361 domain-containing protein [Cellulomonas hominis]NKY06810.1 DUF1361 domain-containing protein [Cellulomonas hominis]GEL46303.1 hypothetical protein CHO01_14190 [Cellulomonas hominis]